MSYDIKKSFTFVNILGIPSEGETSGERASGENCSPKVQ